MCLGDCCPEQGHCYTGTPVWVFDPAVIKLRQSANLNVCPESFVSIVTQYCPSMSGFVLISAQGFSSLRKILLFETFVSTV